MIAPAAYSCPLPGGQAAEEYALSCDHQRARRLLVIPALFDEGHKLRHLAVEVMRRLDGAGIDSFLPDLPGTNESLRPLPTVELEDWRMAIACAMQAFAPSHVLALRGGAVLVPAGLPGWAYAPIKGASVLRTLLRARVLAAREAGRAETNDSLYETAIAEGIELAGYRLGPELVRQLQAAMPASHPGLSAIEPAALGGSGLWLRAEPDHSPDQADALAAILAIGMAAQ